MSARILMTGSRDWTDTEKASDALKAALMLVGSTPSAGTLVHGAAAGADALVAREAAKLGMTLEAHPAEWNIHTDACPAWDKANATCKLAGHRRNAAMISAGAGLVLAFPTHGYALAPGEDRKRTSRGTWDCAEKAKNAGLPTLVVWGNDLYPFGDQGLAVLNSEAQRKRVKLGTSGKMSILEASLPF